MAEFDVDLFVIGAGSGGVRAARIAAGYGAEVMASSRPGICGSSTGVAPLATRMWRAVITRPLASRTAWGPATVARSLTIVPPAAAKPAL